MPIRLLLIDDDARLRSLLRDYLAGNDVVTEEAADGATGLQMLRTSVYDAVILDIMMPGMSGLDVLRKLRPSSEVPVLMLTAKGDETDRVVGLELGADDYLAKPFSPRELLARVRAILRRGRSQVSAEWCRANDVEFSKQARQVKVGGELVELTALELDLFVALYERRGRVLSRELLWELVGRGDTVVSERSIDVHMSHLRKKLRDHEREPRLIQTVRGAGYLFIDGQ
jgi:DNA-binding response OmpR family regulator